MEGVRIDDGWNEALANPMINTTSPGIGPIAARSHSWSNDLTGVGLRLPGVGLR